MLVFQALGILRQPEATTKLFGPSVQKRIEQKETPSTGLRAGERNGEKYVKKSNPRMAPQYHGWGTNR